MVQRTKNKSISGTKQDIRTMARQGFVVSDVISRPKAGTQNAAKYFNDDVWMSTPYSYDGKELAAHCLVLHDGSKDDTLTVTGVELWTKNGLGQYDRNLEDILSDRRSPFIVSDKDGRTFTFRTVEENVADCAAATVSFPHVMEYEEYLAFQQSNFARLDMEAPTVDDYLKYLDHCERDINAGDMPYVGKIRESGQIGSLRIYAEQYRDGGEQHISAECQME